MSNEENTTAITEDSSTDSVQVISPVVKFWLYLIFLIPSIICTLFLLYCLLSDRNMRRALINHVIIVLLIIVLFCEVTMYPWMLYYFCVGNSWQRSYMFCSLWAFIDWAFYAMQITLFAWASIERHILIFHHKWVVTKRKRFYVHYLPLIVILVYYFILYFFVYFFPTCQNTLSNSDMICLSVCLYDLTAFRIFETMTNNIIPSFTIVIFSLALLIRVLRQKQRICHVIQWRKHRKMTVQLLSISILYLLITCPYAFILLLRICGLPTNVGANFENYALFFTYYIALLFPFVVMSSIPELKTRAKTIFRLGRPVRPIARDIMLTQSVRRN